MSNSQQKLHLIGKIKDAHGLKGEVLIIIFSKDYSPWLKLKEIFMAPDEKTQAQACQVLAIRHANLGLIAKLENITDRNQSEKLKGQLIFVGSEHLEAKPGERIFLKEILHFQVFNNKQLIGKISGFSSNGPQDLLVVTSEQNKNPIEIPFVEDFIVKLDMKGKVLNLSLPEGLLDINESGEE